MTGKDDNHLPYDLENMSIPELEALLHRDFCASDGAAPDVDYIMAIAEVIQKKEQALPNYQPMDAEKAWEEFQSFYLTEEGQEYSICRSDNADEKTQISKTIERVPKQKTTKSTYKQLVVAALMAALLAVTMIPVSGYANALQMVIAYWTDDYFSFAPDNFNLDRNKDSGAMVLRDEYKNLWDAAQQREIQNLLIPQYIPNGFHVAETDLYEFDLSDSFLFHVLYTKNGDYIGIDITYGDKKPRTIYEKDTHNVTVYNLGETEYFIFSNEQECVSTLYFSGIEYSFGTTLTEQELHKIIDSMYEE